MPIFKNQIAQRLARWLVSSERPVPIHIPLDHCLLDDLAVGADEIERLHNQAVTNLKLRE